LAVAFRFLPEIRTRFFPSEVVVEEDVESILYVIGDLHGDSDCAKFWVSKIGVVDDVEEPMTWIHPEISLIFMGDYIDKGPHSYQTLEFVKKLTETFPSRVTALMGNHEWELLKDRDPRRRPGYFQLPWSAVHPEEYLHYLKRKPDRTDELVVDLLMNVTLELYAGKHYQSVVLATHAGDGRRYPVTKLLQEQDRPKVEKRLQEYQEAYLDAFRSDTSLGKWLESRPVAHMEKGFLFCHGGLSKGVSSMIDNSEDVDKLNEQVRQNATEEKFLEFVEQTNLGQAAENMLTYRGNHADYRRRDHSGKDPCEELSNLLQGIEGAEHLVVGHTPDEHVRFQCDGTFLAVDSLLGRWIRTSGNFYCPRAGRISRKGTFVCPPLEPSCQGEIVKIGSSGKVNLVFP